MTVTEKQLFESVPANEFNTYWIPCTWFIYRLQEAAKQGKLLNQYALESIMRVGVVHHNKRQHLIFLKGGWRLFRIHAYFKVFFTTYKTWSLMSNSS